ncbi:MAG TPA: thiaminase II [Acidocella sp.]|nr:thiaminase II [Acidocella sp.]
MSTLFERLRADNGNTWQGYIRHPFVLALGDGTLPREKFQKFLIQDYLFLIQYARAYLLLAYKLDDSADMRAAMATATVLLDAEMPLHVSYCAGWGISEPEMAAAPHSLELLAYTRYVLELGLSGDALDLMVALAPCIAGYAEIGAMLAETLAPDNPYKAWIETYTGAEYTNSVADALAIMERLAAAKGAEARYPRLKQIFGLATQCEAAFWETGWR